MFGLVGGKAYKSFPVILIDILVIMERSEAVSTIAYIVFGILLAFGINQGMAFALSTDMPVVAVESNSMVPTFYKGDLLILQGVPTEELAEGDIIVFTPPNRPAIVHRIIELNSDGTFQTKGDANPKQLPFETRIEPEQIHGKEILIVPYLGWVKIGLMEFVIPNLVWVVIVVAITYISSTVYKKLTNVHVLI